MELHQSNPKPVALHWGQDTKFTDSSLGKNLPDSSTVQQTYHISYGIPTNHSIHFFRQTHHRKQKGMMCVRMISPFAPKIKFVKAREICYLCHETVALTLKPCPEITSTFQAVRLVWFLRQSKHHRHKDRLRATVNISIFFRVLMHLPNFLLFLNCSF